MTSTIWKDRANRVRRQPGTPLPPSQKDFFEQGFGCSLEPIRLHVDRDAADALGAEAFAVGRHIVLRQAPPDWNAPSARYLLGHEIAHSLQQHAVGDAAPVVAVGGADDPLEREAHGAAADLLAGRRVGRLSRESHAVVRRVVSIRDGSQFIILGGELKETAPKSWLGRPAYADPSVTGGELREKPPEQKPQKDSKVNVMYFSCGEFEARGTVILTGDPGDDASGVTLGFIQILKEENWAIYRGRSNNLGSMFLLRAGDRKQRWHVCRDTLKGAFLVDTRGASTKVPSGTIFGPNRPIVPMRCRLVDSPADWYELELTNPHTKQPNFLWEVKIKFEFCTVLTLRGPAGYFPQCYVYWTVDWHFNFDPPTAQGTRTYELANSTNVGAVQYSSTPTIPHFARVLTEATTPQCLALSDHGKEHPDIQASGRWENFGVTH